MTKQDKTRLRNLAKELLQHYKDELQIFESMQFDDTTKADARLHIDAIEYQHGNIERLKYEIERLEHFAAVFLV